MTQHVTNGLTTLTQSKTNVSARWSGTLALKAVQTDDLYISFSLDQPFLRMGSFL